MSFQLPAALALKAGRASLHLQKQSPTILFGVGIAGLIGTVALSIRATLSLDAALTDVNSRIEDAKTEDGIDELERVKKLRKLHVEAAITTARLYAPAAVLGVLTISSMTGAHVIMSKRQASLAAALTVTESSYRDYRDRVIEKFGAEIDQQMRHESVDRIVAVEDEDGVHTETIRTANSRVKPSQYARWFDECSEYFKNSSEANLTFLQVQEDYFTDRLVTRGHVFLNEVYDKLGVKRTKEGAVVGWFYEPTNPKRANYIDFGLHRGDTPAQRDFVNGWEKTLLLDFNVDGNILDFI